MGETEGKAKGFALPEGPKGQRALCFDKDRFSESDFSVDAFLHDHRNAASPETLRDDLGVYLKVLRSAMIELIDEDYADFVDLSSGLTGLDKEMDDVRRPLEELRERVLRVSECLSAATKELSARLERRKSLRERKRSLQYLAQTRSSLNKLSQLLYPENKPRDSPPRELLERISSEYVGLQFSFSKCERFVTEEQRRLFERIGTDVLSASEEAFLSGVEAEDEDRVRRCLRIYSTLDRASELEKIIREKVVAPGMRELISEPALQKSPTGLKGVFDGIMAFFDRRLKRLVGIARTSKPSSKKEFDFVLNSFWPEVEQRLEIHTASIFAPGNPELFYSRYGESLEFLKRIAENLDGRESREQFYRHPSYKNFQQKWNLPIYFQIRFQEIAGSLEAVLSEPASMESFAFDAKIDTFALKSTNSCWTSLTQCWAQGIFLVALTHRFWKLSLQIISRYCTWVNVVVKQSWPAIPNSTDNLGGHKMPPEKLKFLVALHSDIRKLMAALPTFLEIVKTRLRPGKQITIFEKCLSDSKDLLESKLPQIQKTVVLQIGSDSVVHLKQINDIPRLFRKTNRDIPTKPCGYVAALMKAPFDFKSVYLTTIGNAEMVQWLEAIFSIITTQYYTAVDGVLTSIQKTEDSLRRLKQMRDRPQQNTERAGVSDDDKIRMQLKVDVDFYCQSLREVGVDAAKVDRLNDLTGLMEKATIAKSNSIQ